MPELPYRENVGAVLFNADGRVFVGERRSAPGAWQLPQGGIDAGEAPRDAVLRELEEETGTRAAVILAEYPDWLTYDLPPEIAVQAFGGRYRGQRQRWFALRFTGVDGDIDLGRHAEVEFARWKWVHLRELPGLAVPFKRAIYETVAAAFARFSVPVT